MPSVNSHYIKTGAFFTSMLLPCNCQVGSFSRCVTLRVSNTEGWSCQPESFTMA